MTLIPYQWIEQAAERIAPYIYHTPLTYDRELNCYIKWENKQVTGSFKVRGALNKVICLEEWERQKGLVTASAGNHGQGVALAGSLYKAQVKVFASDHAVPDKIKAMQRLGAEVHQVRGGYAEAESAGIAYAHDCGATWISPYNDGKIIAGQGTIALELIQDLPLQSFLNWVIPAGGGGLVCGIGAAISTHAQPGRIIAVQSDASSFLYAIYHRGSQDEVVERDSLADGLSGPVEQGSVTIPMVKHYVDDFVLVSEDEIAQAIAYAWHNHHERIEGSAAVSLAAIMSNKVTERPSILVITGGNIQAEVHKEIISHQ